MRYSAISQDLFEALFWWNLELIGRVVVCFKDRTAAGISGHLIGRNSWWWREIETYNKRLLPMIGVNAGLGTTRGTWWGAAESKHCLAFMPQGWWNWQVKWMKSASMESFQYKSQVNGEGFFAYLWVILLYFSPESRLISAVLELGQIRLFWK